MSKVLIIYGTVEGQTAKIAGRIADTARAKGYDALVLDAKAAPPDLTPADADAVIVGASIHVGKHEGYLVDWVKAHRAALERARAAFFSVSMSAAGAKAEDRANAARAIETFVRQTGWRPERVALFGGALQYTHYGLLKRWIMRSIAKRTGNPTDTSRDYEFTDWAAVERFAVDALAAHAAV